MKYKISIILPVFNVENYIKDALNSVIKQTIGFDHLEVIMVDDCSNDNSGKIIDEYESKYENFIAIHLTENSGAAGKPRNIGIQQANAEYLMFLDPDDYYSADACEVLFNKITSEDVDVVFGKYIVSSGKKELKLVYDYFDGKDEIKVNSINEEPLLLTLAPSVWTKIYKKSLIADNNIEFPEKIPAQDLVFVVKSFLKANGIVFLNNYYSGYYRIRDVKGNESVSNIITKEYLTGLYQAYEQTYNILKDLENKECFPYIFKEHLRFWTDSFIKSDTSGLEKIELLKNASFLFEKLSKFDVEPEKKYLIPLFHNIVNKKYSEAVLLSEVFADFLDTQEKLQTYIEQLETERIEAYQHLEHKEKILQAKINELKSKEIELETKKKQIAELQSIAGYSSYKAKNLSKRLKNRLDK